MKIAVLIPTLNEEQNIVQITTKVDRSLMKDFSCYELYIVNHDSHSTDRTREFFLATQTAAKKISFDSGKLGKGNNIIGFFDFCRQYNIDFAATIDADITSMTDDWMKLLLSPLLDGVDYVTPIYKRSKYDGNLTNQLVFPIVNIISNNEIRQPIGGEFSFNKKFMDIFIREYNDYALNYGIDICMTMCAINHHLNIENVYLGKKIHRPGINKMKPMFREVAPALFNSIDYNCLKKVTNQNVTCTYFCFLDDKYIKRGKGEFLKKEAIMELQKSKYESIIQTIKISDFSTISSQDWLLILNSYLMKKANISDDEYDVLTNLFIIRTVTYWNEIANMNLKDSEMIIFDYLNELRKGFDKNE